MHNRQRQFINHLAGMCSYYRRSQNSVMAFFDMNLNHPFGLAIGHSAKGVARNSLGGRREVLLSIDIDITKIPLGPLDDFPIVRFLKDELNFLKIPMPTIRLSGNQVFYGVYF